MERSPFVLVLLAFGAAAALMFTLPNLSNVRVTAGYASYVYSRPIAGRSEFKQVLFGPASTGLSWRLDAQRVSITPFTYSEKFESENAIIGKDKLPLSSQAHIVWRLRPDAQSVQRFMEEFGGWESSADPDKIAKESYDQFIREPFRTITRSVVAQYNGLDVNESLPGISQEIELQVKALLDKTPFEVMSVVMGNSSPPQAVIVAISAKVALNQTLEMKAVEEQIAEKSVAIERKNGEAAGARFAAQAKEQAKAIEEIRAVLDPLYIEFLKAENIKGAERVYVPLGAGPQMVLPIKEGTGEPHRKDKAESETSGTGAGKANQPSPR
jgi:regulator of protease activity HflC (stomatin/prohibitin superfamily)